MTEAMMMLGTEYMFSVSTAAYQSLRRSAAYRWPAQERIGRRPARQFVGPGDETMTLDGTIYPHYLGGIGQIERMREVAGRGDPLALVDGRGSNLGQWCIERVEETDTVFGADGRPRRMDFVLGLVRYGEDE
ncbi:phage tail protein [Mycolicibacterium sp.]|uniref:phage tail protein n=1 Tax=Mycolicibacterium sp. TaxID=2320850 RepID=UPI00355D6F3B